MIGSLRGRILQKQAPLIVLECAGLGYEIETPLSTFLELPAVGQELFLHTHLLVREDAHSLFGFATLSEKLLFRTLLKISGVGAKMGLAILSAMTVSSFERCVQSDDAATLVKIPGVGKKTAQRLIIEMRDKFDGASGSRPIIATEVGEGDAKGEAMDALISLGYKPVEVRTLLAKIDVQDRSAADIIRLALRQTVN